MLHANERRVHAGVAMRFARRHPCHGRLIEIDPVRIQARAAEFDLVKDTASAECHDED